MNNIYDEIHDQIGNAHYAAPKPKKEYFANLDSAPVDNTIQTVLPKEDAANDNPITNREFFTAIGAGLFVLWAFIYVYVESKKQGN